MTNQPCPHCAELREEVARLRADLHEARLSPESAEILDSAILSQLRDEVERLQNELHCIEGTCMCSSPKMCAHHTIEVMRKECITYRIALNDIRLASKASGDAARLLEMISAGARSALEKTK